MAAPKITRVHTNIRRHTRTSKRSGVAHTNRAEQGSTHQENCDADLQENPDDDDDVAVDEDRDDDVERTIVGVHSDEAIKLGEAAQSYQSRP